MDLDNYGSGIVDGLPLDNPNTPIDNTKNIDLTMPPHETNFVSILDISNSKQGHGSNKYQTFDAFDGVAGTSSSSNNSSRLSRKCRTCFADLDRKCKSVFDRKKIENETFKFFEMIALITSLEIQQDDLSTQICTQCVQDVEQAFVFRQKVLNTNFYFANGNGKSIIDENKLKVEIQDEDFDMVMRVKNEATLHPIESIKMENSFSGSEEEDEGSSDTDEESENSDEDDDRGNDDGGFQQEDDPESEEDEDDEENDPLSSIADSLKKNKKEEQAAAASEKKKEVAKPKKTLGKRKAAPAQKKKPGRPAKNKKEVKTESTDEENDDDDDEDDEEEDDKEDDSLKRKKSKQSRGIMVRTKRECPICNKIFTAWKKFLAHIDWHIVTYNQVEGMKIFSSKILECELCKDQFDNKVNLKNHVIEVHGKDIKLKKGHLCEFCGKETRKLANHKMHLMTHTGELPFSCDQCDKKFALPCYLKYHVERKHTGEVAKRKEYGEKKYTCNTCSKTYTNRYSLNVHVRRDHTKEGGFRCEFCDKVFYVRNKLKVHIDAVHATVKPFACDSCNKTFAVKQYLTDHVAARHSNVKPYACTLCDKVFAVKTYLTLHMYKHNDTKEYLCDKCDYKAKQQCNLTRHIFVVHEGGFSFPCEECGKTFTSKRSRERHMLIHRGIKPYSKYTPLEDLPL